MRQRRCGRIADVIRALSFRFAHVFTKWASDSGSTIGFLRQGSHAVPTSSLWALASLFSSMVASGTPVPTMANFRIPTGHFGRRSSSETRNGTAVRTLRSKLMAGV